MLAVCPVDELRDGHEAVELATAACNATAWCNPSCLGRWPRRVRSSATLTQAVRWQNALADPAYRKTYGEATVADRLRQYEQGLPCRLPMPGG